MEFKVDLEGCRGCMKNDENMLNLCDNNLSIVYYKCTGIEVKPHENQMPSNICTACRGLLQEFFEFRERCRKSDHLFRLSAGQSAHQICLKDEPIPIEDEHSEYINVLDDMKSNEDEKVDPMYVNMEPTNWLNSMEDELDEHKDNLIKHEPCDDKEELDNYSPSDDDVLAKVQIKREKTKKKRKIKTEYHEETEAKEIFACDKCDKKFFVRRRFDGHMRQHDGLKVAPCQLCDKEFSKWSYHDQHVESVHSGKEALIKCEFPGCVRTFTTRNTMMGHLRSVHNKKDPSTAQIHMCDICGKTFGRASLLRKHTYTHSADKPFKCVICPRQFPTKHKLKQHCMRHDGIKNYVCPHCGMKKTTMDELKVHINYHTKEKIYKCKYCQKEFGNIGNMGRHIRIVHEGVRAYACTYCDMKFGKSGTLKHHLMTHTGEKPHACEVIGCGKRFIQNVALKAHMKTHKKNSAILC